MTLALSLITPQRPTIPDECDPQLTELIQSCWKEDAKVIVAESVIVSDLWPSG